MRARITPAGWLWLTYAAAVAAFVAASTGCATPAPAAQLAPAAGLRCWIGAELYRVEGPLTGTTGGWWSVRHLASDGRQGHWYVPAVNLTRCAA